MNHPLQRTGCTALLCLLGTLAQAEGIGRTEIDLSRDGWLPLARYETSLKFDGGTKPLRLDNKAFYLPGPGRQLQALLLVTSTYNGHGGPVRWVSERCPDARDRLHTDDQGSNRQDHSRHCLVVNGNFATFKYFEADSPVLAAVRASGLQLFESGYSIRSFYGAQSGDYLRVSLFTRKDFLGLKDVPAQAQVLHKVPPALVAWGEALHKTVSSAPPALRGPLALPPLRFAPELSASATPARLQ